MKLLDTLISSRITPSFVKGVAYRSALTKILNGAITEKTPNQLFSASSDDFWFWLNTEGRTSLKSIIPSMPEEDVQLAFTGATGEVVLREGFSAYKLFKRYYEEQIAPIGHCDRILDFGCGWGRIIRFFLRDTEPSRLWGCDPVGVMINICKNDNPWCNFVTINTKPPTPFEDATFELIYSFSVFSHLSEDMHKLVLAELSRILKPGGLLIVTTRRRNFIEHCARLRARSDLDSIHEGPRSSASAFLDTREYLSRYDEGRYCFSQLVREGEWSYWGEAAIPRDYVVNHWTRTLTLVDYIDDRRRCTQNVIVMKK